MKGARILNGRGFANSGTSNQVKVRANFQLVLPDRLTVLPFENLQMGNLNWSSQQCSSSDSRKEQRAITRIWTDGEDGSYNTAEAAIPDFYEISWAREKTPLLPVAGYIPNAYSGTPDPCQEYVLSANCPGIVSIGYAKTQLEEELQRHWAHLQGPRKRRTQNRINKYKSQWKKYFYLETAEDYHILTHEIRNRRKGLKHQREGRQRSSNDQLNVQRCTV